MLIIDGGYFPSFCLQATSSRIAPSTFTFYSFAAFPIIPVSQLESLSGVFIKYLPLFLSFISFSTTQAYILLESAFLHNSTPSFAFLSLWILQIPAFITSTPEHFAFSNHPRHKLHALLPKMPRGRPKKTAIAATANSAEGPELLPSLMLRRGRSSAKVADVITNSEEDAASSSIEPAAATPRRRGRPPKDPKGATPRGRGRPPKHPKAEESVSEAPTGEEYDADVSNLTTVGSDIASDVVTAPTTAVDEGDASTDTIAGPHVADNSVHAPTPAVDEEDASNATTDLADDVVNAPTPTKRPRGRPPKKSKAVAFAAALTVTPATSNPTGRGRGRPPKNASGKATISGSKPVAENNEELKDSDEPLAVPFSLDNLIGSYTVECPKIKDTWPDDEDDSMYDYTLNISPSKEGDGVLVASYSFSVIAGPMRLSLSKAELETVLHEEQATTFPPSSQPSEGNEETPAKTYEPEDGEEHADNENAANIDGDAGAVAGKKRKATDTAEPVKRGRGRPPKKAKAVQAPAPPPPPKVFFVYRCKADLGYGETTYEGRFGTMQPDDNSCKLLKGTFDMMPIIDERVDFSATKVDDKPGNAVEF